jgi:hypothetical protein
MNIKRLIASVAIVGVVGASTLGIGAGIANASPAESSSGTAVVQPVGWHGGGHGVGGMVGDLATEADGTGIVGGILGASRRAGEWCGQREDVCLSG